MKYAMTALAATIIVSAAQTAQAGNLAPAWIEPEVTAPSGVAGIVCTPFTFWRKGCGGLRLRNRVVVVTRNGGGGDVRADRTRDTTPDRPVRTISRQTPKEAPKQSPKETPEKTSSCSDCEEFKSEWERKQRERRWESKPNWDPVKARQNPKSRAQGRWHECFTAGDRDRLRQERKSKQAGKAARKAGSRNGSKAKGKGKKG